MSRTLMIISPTDVSYEDSFRYLLLDEEYHEDLVRQYIQSLKLNCSGIEDLASIGYILIYSMNNLYEVFLGKKINYSQYQILKEFVENVLSGSKKIEFEIGILDINNDFKNPDNYLDDVEKIMKRINDNVLIEGKGEENVRKKI